MRDFVHVKDIAGAHILALEKTEDATGCAYNLGNGAGFSVLEVVSIARRVTGRDIPQVSAPRRPGDPAMLVASSSKAQAHLGWRPRFPDLQSIVESGWQWHRSRPSGYGA